MNIIIFGIILFLVYSGVYYLLNTKFGIEYMGSLLYTHINTVHKVGEAVIVVVSLLILGFIAFGETAYTLKSHYFLLAIIMLYTFRSFIEWRFTRESRQHFLSLISVSFLLILFLAVEFVFTNPIPVRLDISQVESITLEYIEHNESVTVSDATLMQQTVNSVTEGKYLESPGWYIAESPKLIIKLTNGKEVVIEGIFNHSAFVVSTDRLLFPNKMLMKSEQMELVFTDFTNRE